MALLGRDKETLADAALRALWIRTRHARTELRAVYSQMSQPHVLAVLPVDEQLRLARRLVATREDTAALRVLDDLLGADTTRNLYGRQLADCLLGLFTTYSRHGLRQQADQVRQRLSEHFPSPQTLGGLAPNKEPPMTIRGATTRGARGRQSRYGAGFGPRARPRYTAAHAVRSRNSSGTRRGQAICGCANSGCGRDPYVQDGRGCGDEAAAGPSRPPTASASMTSR